MRFKIPAALLACCLLLTSCALLRPTSGETTEKPLPDTDPGTAPAPDTDPVTVPATEPETEPETVPVTEPQTEPATPVLPTRLNPIPGEKTLRNFLCTALSPLGKVMYVFGGGWNEADDGAGVEATSIGLSPAWEAFTAKQDASYNTDDHRYEIHNGLDCSGFVGWAVYNTLQSENGHEGYVTSSTKMAKAFADRGLGSFTEAGPGKEFRPGDIVSMSGHVWISLGTCADGSVVILHCSPNGVILCGTVKDGEESTASKLAREYTGRYFPEWYAKYPAVTRSASSYLSDAVTLFRWSDEVLSDEEGLSSLSAEELLRVLFEE